MMFGKILVSKGLATEAQIDQVIELQKSKPGRLGDLLVGTGIITPEQLKAVLNEPPTVSGKIEEIGLDRNFLTQHIAKGMYLDAHALISQIIESSKLPSNMVNTLVLEMVERKLIHSAGAAGVGGLSDVRYQLTKEGQQFAIEACNQNQYSGPAPVSLEDFQQRIQRQCITNEHISKEDIASTFADIIVPDDFIKRLGPGINSGQSMLIYGPAGNGKTTVAEKIAEIFKAVVYIPYCIEVGGSIIKIFDPSVHKMVQAPAEETAKPTLRRDKSDKRWVSCFRPVLITGGELTLEMLDLKFNEIAKFYEAPLHMKALNGTFIIDDFGRQVVSPEELLNRWIVPLNSRVDYLTLHSGKSFSIPFDELVIFSTNMAPNDLMDPAFLRRIPYKLETKEPTTEAFHQIFNAVAAKQGLELSEAMLEFVIDQLSNTIKKPLACYQPKFIIDQVVSACKYEGTQPAFTEEMILDALANLYVSDTSYVGQVVTGKAE